MPNWVNCYATVTGERKKVEEFMTFFLDSSKDNKDRKSDTYFYRAFLLDDLNLLFEGEKEEGEVSISFVFDIAWEMNRNLTHEEDVQNCAKVQDVAKRLKLDVEIEGDSDTGMFKQRLVYKAHTYDRPQLELTEIEPTDCTCNKCGAEDYIYQEDETDCWSCGEGKFE